MEGILSSGTTCHLGLFFFGQLGPLDVVGGMRKGGAEGGGPLDGRLLGALVVPDGRSAGGGQFSRTNN